MKMFDALRQLTYRSWLVQPPAVWGKLPSHADYVHYRATAQQAHDWQKWVTEVWLRRPLQARESDFTRASRRGRSNWLQLEVGVRTDLATVPVAFILQPGSLDFAPQHFIQGVMVVSQDAVGRECPLIIYQIATLPWMSQIWCEQEVQNQPSLTDVRESSNDHSRHLLYWLARVAACVHANEMTPETLCGAVDTVWQEFEPSWAQLMKKDRRRANTVALRARLSRLGIGASQDAAKGLKGVQQLPWANWPERILRPQRPMPVFWQQDVNGGYVSASDNFQSLWKT